ncbi:MAG TPA: triose-phosphate isomerase [Dongiaceae bacterium]|nr:triose-phosphate isomerase [Dongiaceae bacterium]
MATLKPLIAGNWKMNGLRAEGLALARAVQAGSAGVSCELLVCPPATLLADVAQALAGSAVGLGGQDCAASAPGAHTGDIAAAMLADLGCRYVIVGHSERRTDHGETDAIVRAKAEAAGAAGLIPVVCLGETETQRDRGEALAVVARQLAGSLPAGASAAHTVVAYEPVWAIGTGRTPSSADIVAVHGQLRRELARRGSAAAGIRLLYGGSVKPANAAEILALPDVNGALIGGASLKAQDFLAIARSCPI